MFYPISTGDEGGGGDAVKRDILVLSVVFWVQICSIGPHLPAGWGDAVKWNIVVLSVVSAVQTYSIGPHLPAPFWCGRVFGQCEEGGDHLSRRFFSETTEMLNRIPCLGASCNVQYSPHGGSKATANVVDGHTHGHTDGRPDGRKLNSYGEIRDRIPLSDYG